MTWFTWPFRLAAFSCWFAGQMLTTNVRATAVIFGLRRLPTPILFRHDSACRNDVELALLSIAISLTPGTLALATTSRTSQWEVYVHDMYSTSREQAADGVADLERRLLGAVRRQGYQGSQEAE